MPNRNRRTALLLCLCMALALLVSFAYVAIEADHDCAGDACEVCERIAHAEALAQSLALLGALLAALPRLPSALRARHAKKERRGFAAPTPVRWKVRLND